LFAIALAFVGWVGAVGPVFADVLGNGLEDMEGAVGVGDEVALNRQGVGEGAGEAGAAGVGRPYGRLVELISE
jgi:hypothetical protein